MANQTPSRFGQINAAGDPTALFLKVFGGQVLTALLRNSAYRDKGMWRSIPSGKSAQFPATGLATAGFHTPGAEILGQQIKGNERIINIEDLLLSAVFISNIDELMTHFDLHGPYSEQLGQALAKFLDQNLSRELSIAARAAATVSGLQGGYQITDADFDADGTKLFGGIFNAGVRLDQVDAPQGGRYAMLKPTQYALLVRSEKPINTLVNPGGNNGSLASGNAYEVNSIKLNKSNNYVQTDDSANDQLPTRRQLNYSTSRFQVGTSDAPSFGTVALQDITTEMGYDIRRQGTLLLSKYLVGHGTLRSETAVEGITS